MTAPSPAAAGLPDEDWPYRDAHQHHRWVAQYRIPVVRRIHPAHRYEVALVVNPDADWHVERSVEPTEDEARVIGSYIDFRRSWYRDDWAVGMLRRPLDTDNGTNTVVLLKHPDGGWSYRRMTHSVGYPLWPQVGPDGEYRTGRRLTLVELLDHIHDLTDSWSRWKAAHPDALAPVPHDADGGERR